MNTTNPIANQELSLDDTQHNLALAERSTRQSTLIAVQSYADMIYTYWLELHLVGGPRP